VVSRFNANNRFRGSSLSVNSTALSNENLYLLEYTVAQKQ